jgi:hypothetical protein
MQVRLTPQAATDIARLDAFLRPKDPRAADRLQDACSPPSPASPSIRASAGPE